MRTLQNVSKQHRQPSALCSAVRGGASEQQGFVCWFCLRTGEKMLGRSRNRPPRPVGRNALRFLVAAVIASTFEAHAGLLSSCKR